MTPHALEPEQAVRVSVAHDVRLAECRLEQQRLAPHAHHAPRGGDPEPAALALTQADDCLAQRRGRVAERLDAPRAQEREAFGRADPQHALRVLDERVHAVRGQPVRGAARGPGCRRPRGETLGRAHPQRAVGGLGERIDAVGRQAIVGRESLDATLAQAAEPAVERARPDAAVVALVHGVDARLAEPVDLVIAACAKRPALEAKVGQPAALAADPQPVAGRGDRVDAIVHEAEGRDALDPLVLEPVESALGRREPDAFRAVDVDRPDPVRRQAVGARIGREGRVVEPLDPRAPAEPQVAFAVLEDRGHRAATRRRARRELGGPVRVGAQQARARAHPDVLVAVAHERQRLYAAQRLRHPVGRQCAAIPAHDAAVGADPHVLLGGREQAVHLPVRESRQELHDAAVAQPEQAGVARPEK